MGPDGLYEPGDISDHARVQRVEINPWRVGVVIPFLEEHDSGLRIGVGFGPADGPGVEIRGGNTNDGDAARYGLAQRRYQQAIEIAKRMEAAVAPGYTLHGLDWDGDDITEHIVAGKPDYVLGAYLLARGERPLYMRGVEPEKLIEIDGSQTVGLEGLRAWALKVARGEASKAAQV